MEHGLPDNIRDVIISVLLNLSLRLIFLGKLIIVSMAIFISILVHLLFDYLFSNRLVC